MKSHVPPISNPSALGAFPAPCISIRPFEDSDAPALFDLTLAQGSDLDAFAWRSRIQSAADELAFVSWARAAEHQGSAWSRAILVDGVLSGCVSLYAPHPGSFPENRTPTLQMGYWVARRARGLGASWQAMELLNRTVAELLPESSTLGVRTRSQNGASLACAARLGLTLQGMISPSMFDPNDSDLILIGPMLRADLADRAALPPARVQAFEPTRSGPRPAAR